MYKFLPLVFLICFASIFGISWIVTAVDPDVAPWYFFALFVLLLFISVWGLLGLVFYFLRTKLYKRFSPNWYFKTSFKMAFFMAAFIAICAILAILQLVTLLNVGLVIVALGLFAVWSYLGKNPS